MFKSSRHIRGFNLIEAMVTVAIAAILSGVAMPSFLEMISSNQMSSQANEIHRSIVIARSEAIKRGQDVTVCAINASQDNCDLSKGWDQGWIVKEANNNGALSIISVHPALTDNYTLLGSHTGLNSQITFSPSGTASTSGHLVLCKNNQISQFTRSIFINRFGKVSVKNTDRYTPINCGVSSDG
ncbi:GspH/FimT family pseudopilin [Thalassotalea aquiviva]|uniref:GspH/FimT family pseudopilin n=1 Tax=Thalassotalea aquiviva TaxID=3242415 RepID=UPI00352B503A